jgi:hypothetical protein
VQQLIRSNLLADDVHALILTIAAHQRTGHPARLGPPSQASGLRKVTVDIPAV